MTRQKMSPGTLNTSNRTQTLSSSHCYQPGLNSPSRNISPSSMNRSCSSAQSPESLAWWTVVGLVVDQRRPRIVLTTHVGESHRWLLITELLCLCGTGRLSLTLTVCWKADRPAVREVPFPRVWGGGAEERRDRDLFLEPLVMKTKEMRLHTDTGNAIP